MAMTPMMYHITRRGLLYLRCILLSIKKKVLPKTAFDFQEKCDMILDCLNLNKNLMYQTY